MTIECRASIDRAFGADRSSLTLDDALNRRKADPRAFELLGQMQALKHTEQLVLVLHVEAHAVVLDEYLHVFALPVNAADLDLGRLARCA